jgi:hypothetical protein
MEKNKYQKKLYEDLKFEIENLNGQIRFRREECRNLSKSGKTGAKVIIRNGYTKYFVIFTEDKEWQLTSWTSNKQELLNMIQENGWVLIREENIKDL